MPPTTTERPDWQLLGDRWYAITWNPGLHGGVEWDPLTDAWCWYVYLGDDLHAEGQEDSRTGAQDAAEGSAEGAMDR